MSKSAFGIDHGVISKLAPYYSKERDVAGEAGAGAVVGAAGYSYLGARRGLKGVNQKVKADRAAGAKIPRGVAGMARVGGSAGGAMGRVVGRPGKTALAAGGVAALSGGAAALNNRRLKRKSDG